MRLSKLDLEEGTIPFDIFGGAGLATLEVSPRRKQARGGVYRVVATDVVVCERVDVDVFRMLVWGTELPWRCGMGRTYGDEFPLPGGVEPELYPVWWCSDHPEPAGWLSANTGTVSVIRDARGLRIVFHSGMPLYDSERCGAAGGGWSFGTPPWNALTCATHASADCFDISAARNSTADAANAAPPDTGSGGRDESARLRPAESHEEEMNESEIEAMAAPVIAYLREHVFPTAERANAALREYREAERRRRTDDKAEAEPASNDDN